MNYEVSSVNKISYALGISLIMILIMATSLNGSYFDYLMMSVLLFLPLIFSISVLQAKNSKIDHVDQNYQSNLKIVQSAIFYVFSNENMIDKYLFIGGLLFLFGVSSHIGHLDIIGLLSYFTFILLLTNLLQNLTWITSMSRDRWLDGFSLIFFSLSLLFYTIEILESVDNLSVEAFYLYSILFHYLVFFPLQFLLKSGQDITNS